MADQKKKLLHQQLLEKAACQVTAHITAVLLKQSDDYFWFAYAFHCAVHVFGFLGTVPFGNTHRVIPVTSR
jgi:uncharacterized membrane protein